MERINWNISTFWEVGATTSEIDGPGNQQLWEIQVKEKCSSKFFRGGAGGESDLYVGSFLPEF
jgi:hypothetical protein